MRSRGSRGCLDFPANLDYHHTMSRHRDVRNMNYEDELDDDALSDGAEEELTSEEQVQMDEGLDRIREVIGNEETSGIPDSQIRDGLWNSYFSVEETLQWIFAEQQKKAAAMERKASSGDGYEEQVLPRMPMIFLAQQRHMEQVQQELTERGELPAVIPTYYEHNALRRLHTISERTERSEVSATLPSRNHYLGANAPRLSSYSDTTYSRAYPTSSEDPNYIPPSPSHSAAWRMSYYEAPPSRLSSTASRSTIRPLDMEPVPPIDTMPDISDFQSKSHHEDLPPPTPPKDEVPTPTPPSTRLQSKLSKLASARASSASNKSESSKTSQATARLPSEPARPQVSSRVQSWATSDSAPSLPPKPQSRSASASVPSSTSSHVRRAIDAAMQMEDMLNVEQASKKSTPTKPSSVTSSSSSSRTPTIHQAPASPGSRTTSSVSRQSSISKRPTSPESKSTSSVSRQSSVSKPSTIPESKTSTRSSSISSAKQPSKLALLAQAKAEAKRTQRPPTEVRLQELMETPLSDHRPTLPESSTEYVTPIANGPTVTTALTTTYHSLYSLTEPGRPPVSPAHHVVQIHEVPLPEVGKKSKLAMKIKKAHDRHEQPPAEEYQLPSIPPIFLSKDTSGRANPSAFASLLVDPWAALHDDGREGRHSDHDMFRRRSKKHSDRSSPKVSKSLASDGPQAFDFTSPSPDDIVFNARKGTNLVPRKSTSSTTSSASSASTIRRTPTATRA
ncbi:hypothetical protein BDV98DRAFT_223531 [Pterulicium gracile]|uniref:HBS1-like protein N-terminal domain-containing protein n=1 Tax=Pterulicium gracile TaxID=1884261 RepID=A0A5C3R3U7_9AGAR|nr:hypothetical protein BDV98DRAFT_223531 [Pterula gracilis]